MSTQKMSATRKLVEASLLVALATVLSVFKLAELPYGGSITLASMLPVVLLSYRHGTRWGLGGGAVFAVLQQLLGLKNLSYFTTWQSVVAIIYLDYLIAFTVIGFGGVFRRSIERQNLSLAVGSAFVCLLRYICHVISGATVWAGLSIPDSAALGYSLVYNATYMIPETVVLVAAAYCLGSLLDFRKDQPVRLVRERSEGSGAAVLTLIAWLFVLAAGIADVVLIFAHLQNAETGKFDFTGLAVERFAGSFWLPVVIVTAACAALAAACFLFRRRFANKPAAAAEAAAEAAVDEPAVKTTDESDG